MGNDDKNAVKKLPSYLGGFTYGGSDLGYFPDFFPGQKSALAEQMAQGYGQAALQPTIGPPINAATGLPISGNGANFLNPTGAPGAAIGNNIGPILPTSPLGNTASGYNPNLPTKKDFVKELDKIYTPMGTAVPKPVVKPVSPVTTPPKKKNNNNNNNNVNRGRFQRQDQGDYLGGNVSQAERDRYRNWTERNTGRRTGSR